jgi:formimidoylglutamate deiminase
MVETRLHCRHALLTGGWAQDVLIELDRKGFIAAVLPGVSHDDATRLHGFVIPGMPNLHSHGFQYLMAGRTGPSPGTEDHFWSWRKQMYRLANRLDPGQYEDCLAWVYLQMLRAGYTACAEFHYLHHQPDGRPYADTAEMSRRVLAAAHRASMPLTLLPVLYSRSGFAADDVEPAQRRFRFDADGYSRLIEDCRSAVDRNFLQQVGLAPHSLRAVAGEVLRELSQITQEGQPVHIHVAEQSREVTDCLQHTGARPVQWLLENVRVDADWCLVHATHMTAGERASAAATGAVAGLCPTTEADLGDGVFDLDLWIGHAGAFGIGSDSNIRLSVGEELRLLEYEQRLQKQRRNVLAKPPVSTGENLYTAASLAGAKALAQPVGRLAPGARADLVELDGAHPLLGGLSSEEVMDAWIFAGGKDMIRSVWTAGRMIVQGGRHAQEESIERSFRAVVGTLWKP